MEGASATRAGSAVVEAPNEPVVGAPGPATPTGQPERIHPLLRGFQAQRAFFRMGWLAIISYPVLLVTRQLSLLISLIMYSFVSELISDVPRVGGDYFTYVTIGLLVKALLDGGLTGFGFQVQEEIQTGRLEGYLVEPVRWSMLPFGLMQFAILFRIANTLVAVAFALVLGLDAKLDGVLATIGIVALGVAATASIGLLSASVRILSKRSDPVMQIYQAGAMLFAGTFFSIDQIPAWIRPLSYAVPHTYVMSAARRLLMPGGDGLAGPDIMTSVLALLAWCVVFYAFGFFIYHRVMEKGRELGALAGY